MAISRKLRGLVTLGAVMALVLASVPTGLAAGPAAGESESPPRALMRYDADNDRIFEDLEVRLDEMAANDRLSVIVTMDGPASVAATDGLAAAVGGFGVTHRWTVINGFAATLTAAQVRALAKLPGIKTVEEDGVMHSTNDTAQSSFGVTKARIDAGVDGNGDNDPATYSSADLVAAVIDTGCDRLHLDLDDGKIIGFQDFVGTQTASYDDNGHGSHVAGTIAGDGEGRADRQFKGVAPAAALVCVKVLDANGSGSFADVIDGINWVVNNRATFGIEALNLSLGANGCNNGTDAPSAAVNNAHANGIVAAVAAGNAGPGTCTVGTPGAADGALTVGAMADMGVNGFKQAYFSSRGLTSDGRIKPDVSAPGVSITSVDNGTSNGYAVFSGTSMATPFVAGVSLLMRDANPALSSQQVKDIIRNTAVDWGRAGNNQTAGTSGPDADYGAGRLDAYAAIEAAKGADIGASPAMPTHQFQESNLSGTGAQVDYLLNVTTTAFPIAATLIHPGITAATANSPDFDMSLFNPSGTKVAEAITNRRQDELGFLPSVTGTYTLRVYSFAGSGAFFVDISAGLGADVTAPTMTSTAPAAGATGVAINTNVSVTFSEPMDQTSAQGAFSINPLVAGAISWSGNTMTFNPNVDLARNTVYTATVSTAAKDVAGKALTAPVSWSFTTTNATTVTASPTAVTIETGTLRGGAVGQLATDNGAFYLVNSTTSGTRTTAWYGGFTGVTNSLTNLKVTYSGKNSRSCTQTVAIWRWTDSTWVQLDSRTVGTTEVLIANLAPAAPNSAYVSGGELRIRIRCSRGSPSFFASGDFMQITYDQP